VGGTRTIGVDVRVIATTNRDLTQSVERKEFRQDLFFRLNVVPIHVPPLRERHGDIPLLAESFMRRYAKKHGCPVGGFSKSSLEALQHHQWPGNIRELQNVVERAVILSAEGALIEPDLLGLTVMSSGRITIPTNPSSQSEESNQGATIKAERPLPKSTHDGVQAEVSNSASGEILSLGELEKRHIFQALEAFGQNRTKTAKHLGISIRTLRNKLNEYGSNELENEASEDNS
jgi:DNA-binding NtrC family response regulator